MPWQIKITEDACHSIIKNSQKNRVFLRVFYYLYGKS